MAEQATIESRKTQTRAGKYLTFGVADEEYGLEILKVREIIRIMDITSVPHTPQYVKGVINLRGKVIPVVDLRMKVGMPEAERTDQTCIIVVEVDSVEMGIVVDSVSEVLNIAEEDIADAPSFGDQVNTDFILGMGKAAGNVTILLDISKLLSQSDITEIRASVSPSCSPPPDRTEAESEEQEPPPEQAEGKTREEEAEPETEAAQ